MMMTVTPFVARQPLTRKAARSTRSICVHESGHAVIAHRLGGRVRRVSVLPGQIVDQPHVNGFVEWQPPRRKFDQLATERQLQIHMIVALAGPAAQRRAGFRGIRAGARDDFISALDAALPITRSLTAERALWRYAEAEARSLVAVHWPEIEAVAAELQTRGELTGAEFCAVLADFANAHVHAMERITADANRDSRATLRQMREDERRADDREARRRDQTSRRTISAAVLDAVVKRIAAGGSTKAEREMLRDLFDGVGDYAARHGIEPTRLRTALGDLVRNYVAAAPVDLAGVVPAGVVREKAMPATHSDTVARDDRCRPLRRAPARPARAARPAHPFQETTT